MDINPHLLWLAKLGMGRVLPEILTNVYHHNKHKQNPPKNGQNDPKYPMTFTLRSSRRMGTVPYISSYHIGSKISEGLEIMTS